MSICTWAPLIWNARCFPYTITTWHLLSYYENIRDYTSRSLAFPSKISLGKVHEKLIGNLYIVVCDSCVKSVGLPLHPPWCQRIDENSQEFSGSIVYKTGKVSLTLICRIEHGSSSDGMLHWSGSLTLVILDGTTEIHFCKYRFLW